MSKRPNIVRLSVAMGILLLVVSLFLPASLQEKVSIHASSYDVARQLMDHSRWPRWCITADSATRYEFTITSMPSDTTTTMYSRRPMPLWRKLYYCLSPDALPLSPIHDLKSFMEDTRRHYGFDLRVVPVRDSLILTASMPRHQTDSAGTTHLYRRLLQLIHLRHLSADTAFFYKTLIGSGDSARIAVGIPVHQPTKDTAGITLLHLPPGGKLLTSSWRGTYGSRQRLYDAMALFMKDENLRPVALPLEKYLIADTLVHPDQHIAIDIFYPVF